MKYRYSCSVLTLVAVSVMQVRMVEAQFGKLFGGGPKVDVIHTTELKNLLDRQEQAETKAKKAGTAVPKAGFVLVDVRSVAEINVSIIPGAITKADFEKDREQYRGRTVIPYCTVGVRSGTYARQLAASGMKVRNYKGSILEWVGAELPLVTLDGQPTNRVHTYSNRYRVPSKYQQVTQ